MFFSKTFHRCYSTIGKRGQRRIVPLCCWHQRLQGLELPFPLEEYFPVEAEMCSTVQLWFISVISGELQKSLTRPNVEVKFSNMTFEIPFIKGEGQIFGNLQFGSGLLRLGLGGLGVGNCLVYDFRYLMPENLNTQDGKTKKSQLQVGK